MNDIQKKRLFAIFEEIQRYVKFFQNPPQNTNYKGYFIEFNAMEAFKKKILFEEIKNLSSSIQFSQLNLKENLNFNKINDYISQTKFESIKDLIKELNCNNKYYLIPDSLWNKICKIENKDEKGITFYIKDNKINIEFDNNEKISFSINKGIIEKSSIITENINTKRSNNAYKNTYLKIQIDANKSNAQTFPNLFNNEYLCINCKSDIELQSIIFSSERNEELMTFKCTGNCGIQKIYIKNYIEQFIKNTYLYEKCSVCKVVQKNEKNIFIFCINCKNIYCDSCKRKIDKFNNNKYIYINEMNKKCLIHGKDITSYCYIDKKNLCEECLNKNEHNDHSKVYMDKILSPILSDEEIEIFFSILEYFKQVYSEELHINKKNKLIEKYQRQIKEIDNRENSFLNQINTKNKDNEIKLKEEFNSKLKNLTDNIIKDLYSSIISLGEKTIEIDTLNNFFIFLENMKKKYIEIIKSYQEEYNKSVKDNKDLIDKEKNSIISIYKTIRIKIKSDTDSQIKKLKESYENEKLKNTKESDNGLERLNELILYSYNSNKNNYHKAKNMYNLMSFYYQNKGIYLSVIQKKIDEFENKKDLLSLIEKKKHIPFDDFISNTIKRDFFEPSFIGLKYIDSIPFMNPILHCFTQIEKLVNFFKYSQKYKSFVNSKEKKIYLSNSFKYLIENLWPTNDKYINNSNFHNSYKEKYFSPYIIRDRLIKMNESLDPKNRNSPKDLIIFIILTLHKELNYPNINILLNNINNNIIPQIDEKNRQIMLNYYTRNFARENMSIISDLFFSMKEIIINCDKCKTTKYKFQNFFYLDFQLDEILKNKLRKSLDNSSNRFTLDIIDNAENNYIINDQDRNYTQVGRFPFKSDLIVVDILDCFKNKKTKAKMYCDICKEYIDLTYFSKITFSPEILIIFLSRFENINSRIKFKFAEDLNIEKYIDLKEYGFSYKLIGVVISLDEPDKDKQFIAFCRSPIDQKWYKYDDCKVSLVRNVHEEIFRNNIPNILFYQKNNNKKF